PPLRGAPRSQLLSPLFPYCMLLCGGSESSEWRWVLVRVCLCCCAAPQSAPIQQQRNLKRPALKLKDALAASKLTLPLFVSPAASVASSSSGCRFSSLGVRCLLCRGVDSLTT